MSNIQLRYASGIQVVCPTLSSVPNSCSELQQRQAACSVVLITDLSDYKLILYAKQNI